MRLRNPFSDETRALFIDVYACYLCGRNQPLELHHIFGRESACAFNASVLCLFCHEHVRHDDETRARLTVCTVRILRAQGYRPGEDDWAHLRRHPFLIPHVRAVL